MTSSPGTSASPSTATTTPSGPRITDVLIDGNNLHDLDYTGSQGVSNGYGITAYNGVQRFTITDNRSRASPPTTSSRPARSTSRSMATPSSGRPWSAPIPRSTRTSGRSSVAAPTSPSPTTSPATPAPTSRCSSRRATSATSESSTTSSTTTRAATPARSSRPTGWFSEATRSLAHAGAACSGICRLPRVQAARLRLSGRSQHLRRDHRQRRRLDRGPGGVLGHLRLQRQLRRLCLRLAQRPQLDAELGQHRLLSPGRPLDHRRLPGALSEQTRSEGTGWTGRFT